MGGLPDDLTVSDLYANAEKLENYHKAAMNDGDYSAKLFALRGSRSSTMAGLERMHRILDGKTLSEVQTKRLKKIDADWKSAEEDRLVEYGYLMLEEIEPLRSRIASAKILALATALGETDSTQQLTDEERAALKMDELSKFKLSTVRDRVVELGLELPEYDDELIERVYRLQAAPNVLVGVQPTEEADYGYYGDTAGAGAQYVNVVGLNATAIAYYGDRDVHREEEWKLQPVTLADLKEISK
jgi:hypothetical protein